MNWAALFKTFLLCLISMVVEGISSTKDGRQWFESLKQPKNSPSFSIWYVIGGLYYIICGIIAYRQFAATNTIFTVPIILLSVIMLINGLTNLLLLRFKSLKSFYWALYPFTAFVASLFIILWRQDIVSAGLAFIYLGWLVYDIQYFYNLWQLNAV
jgi:tryptophan-rich sensory protein